MNRFVPTCALLAAAILAALPARAQQILPDHLGSWVASPPVAASGTDPRRDAIRAEAGEAESQSRTYTQGDKTIGVVVRRFADPSGAYQFYTSELTTKMNASTLGELTAVDNEKLVAMTGNLVTTLSGPRNISEADLQTLIASLRRQSSRIPLPPVRTYIPRDGLVDGTQRYALGKAGFAAALADLGAGEYAVIAPEVKFELPAEAMMARYERANDRAVLLVVEYPNPQLAEQRIHHLETTLPVKDVKVERKGSLLLLVLAPSSPAYGDNLRAAVNYETQVTWNEPSHTITDKPWLVVVRNIFTGTLVFCVIAVVLGVAFGGVRVLTKRFFPGKVFDRPEQMEVLQLGLSGKRIDPRDFY